MSSKMQPPICIFRPGKHTAEAVPDLANLLTGDILDSKVVVISIAGRFRQGKSFLMNFLIKYLRAKGAPNWLENEDPSPLGGFDWRHTRKRVTLGVLIWPEIFKLKSASGEEIVVILMDTQGVFDTDTTIKDCTSIFSLSVLLSSIQMFNIKQNIQGDDLSHLELFTEFGRLVCSDNAEGSSQSNQKPFQDLIFLVRDWAYPEESPYGWEGGHEVLEEELQKSNLEGELATMRASIKNCFESLKCFLMPHPGEKVDTSSQFKGNVADIKPIFVEYMKTFIEDIFRVSNLKPKRVHGRELTVRDFMVFAELYVREMHSDKLPTPRTLYDATVNATNSAVVSSCFEAYQTRVSALVQGDPQTPERFEELHNCILTEIFTQFNQTIKMGGQSAIAASSKDLNARIANAKQHFKHANTSAYEKKQFDAKTKKLEAEQAQLKDQIKKVGDANGELQTRLDATEAEKKEIARDSKQLYECMRKELEAAKSRRNTSWCAIS